MRRKRYSRDGRTVTRGGYVRLTRGEFRFKYEHRAVIIRLAREFFYHGHVNGDGDLPPGWTVHHQDFDKRNNQPGNLIVMSVGFHAAAGTARNHRTQERDERGRFLPSWVSWDEVGAGEEWGEGRE